MSSRGSAPAVGVALLLVVAVGLSGVVGAAALDAADSVGEPPPTASLSLSVEDGALVFEHGGGEALDVRELRLRVRVDGDSLAHQPPVPFFSARGFDPGPTGPFNSAADQRWTAGERASLEPAGTNSPAIDPGDRVTVDVYVGDARLVRLTTVG